MAKSGLAKCGRDRSQCTTSTPMTTFTPTIAWCTSCVERARRAHCSTPGDDRTPHLAQVLSKHFDIHGHGRTSLTRFSFSSTCSFPVLLRLLPPLRAGLCYSANKESEDAYDVSTSFTKTFEVSLRYVLKHATGRGSNFPALRHIKEAEPLCGKQRTMVGKSGKKRCAAGAWAKRVVRP